MQEQTDMPSAYELEQQARIAKWRQTSPDVLTQAFGRAMSPAAQAVQRAIPADWFKATLERVQRAAILAADRRAILRRAGVDDLAALRKLDLEACDRLTSRVRLRGAALAGGTGALFGVAGAVGMVADVPTLLLQTFRVIHQTGLCYGEDPANPGWQRVSVAIFALASANTLEEKQAALAALEHDADTSAAALRDGFERTAERELAKEAAMFSVVNLAALFTRRLGVRKAGGAVPVIGALVGGAVNAWYLNDVAIAARIGFQLRWLQAQQQALPNAIKDEPAKRRRSAK